MVCRARQSIRPFTRDWGSNKPAKIKTTMDQVKQYLAEIGAAGGRARAKALTPKERKAIATKASNSRTSWGRKPSCLCGICRKCKLRAAAQGKRKT